MDTDVPIPKQSIGSAAGSLLGAAAGVAGPAGLLVQGVGALLGGLLENDEAKKAAELEREATGQLVSNIMREARADIADTKFGYISANVRADTGSPLEILAEKTASYRREIQTTRRVGATRAAAYAARGDTAVVQGAGQFVSSLGQLAAWGANR
jgi:hypothetical protein